MPDIAETVAAYIDLHQLLPRRGEVIVAVSGGADSLCLLHLLRELCGPARRYPGVYLRAAHVNHRLRGEDSARDAVAVAALATAWGIPFTAGEADVPALARAEGRSLEDAARIARYRFLRDVARGEPIAVAHHADDQVETLLLHWLRGSGLSGMVGMMPRQRDIIRPLLAITHAQALAYCREHGITPLDDLSNDDLAYTRNRIRHQLLPLLESINPGFRGTLLRNSEVMTADLDFIESQVEAAWPQVIASEQDDIITLRITPLLELPVSMQRHLLRRVTARLCSGQSPLEVRHYALLDDLMRLPADRQPRELHLPQGLRAIRVLYDLAFAHAPGDEGEFAAAEGAMKRAPTGIDAMVTLSIPGEVFIPGTPWVARAEMLAGEEMEQARRALRRENWQALWHFLPASLYMVYIDAASIGGGLHVRTRRPGDRMQPLGMTHEKKVQDILVDAHIARPERESIPLFFSTTEPPYCAWLGGVCLDQRARLTSATEHVVRVSLAHV